MSGSVKPTNSQPAHNGNFVEIYNPDDPDPEPLDLVDSDDRVVGRTYQSLVYEGFNHVLQGFFCRQADVLLQNDQGELFTPIRQPHKMLAPNGLDFAAAEHVQAGESYIDAAVRGVWEELLMHVAPDDLTYLGRLTPLGTRTLYFSNVYLLRYNGIPDYNPDDYRGFVMAEPERLVKMLHHGALAKKTLLGGVELLLANRVEQHGNEDRDQQVVDTPYSHILE